MSVRPGYMYPYPKVLSGVETIKQALAGRSLARYGDGELRLTTDRGSAISQPANLDLRNELVNILRGPTKSLVCIPRQGIGPKADRWADYTRDKYAKLMKQEVYGSAFITRPDSEPEINTEEYWADVRALWKGRKVVLVMGTDKGSLDERFMYDALDVRPVWGPRVNAYTEINRIEEEIGKPPPTEPVILCLGATATVLAERLAKKGCWALDLGHIGKFMPKHLRYKE